MLKNRNKFNSPDSRQAGVFEYILLAVCIAVLVLRATLTQAPYMNSSAADSIFNISTSAFLMFAAISWLVSNFGKKNFNYRFSGIEYGLLLLVIASIIGIFVASNKRAAINDFAMLIAPILMAILLIQILNSNTRIKVLLYVIAALGAVNAYGCFDQYRTSNELTVTEYKSDPDLMLKRLNIEKGSFQQMLFEHRLYSKDIRGFFTTSNSAGSFFILAIAAATVLLIEKRQALKIGQGGSGELAARGLVLAVIFAGLCLTRSKGAFAAISAAAVLFLFYNIMANFLAGHKRLLLVVGVLVISALVCTVIWYGTAYDTLPGGKSMAVRWEYWVAAARMLAAHPFGVGPAGFAEYYPTYKIPAALEVIKDPHNFPLSILTQYGPIGLIGFLMALIFPLGKSIFSTGPNLTEEKNAAQFKRLAMPSLLISIVVMLSVRPLVLQNELGNAPAVKLLLIALFYVLPAAIFTAAFVFLSINEKQTYLSSYAQVILFCAVLGILIHNLIDFAIFEPGVYTAFWAILAGMTALNFNLAGRKALLINPSQFSASALAVCGIAAIGAVTFFCVMPVIKTSIKIGSAKAMLESAAGYADSNSVLPSETQANILQGVFDYANRQLYSAADDDKLNPDPPAFNARLCIEFYKMQDRQETKLLEWAQNRLLLAIKRDPADFKNYEKLAEVLMLFAEQLPEDKQTETLNTAYNALAQSLARYPSCERLLMKAGRLAERLGKKPEAIEHYRKAIETEQAYRIEFEKMYPGKAVFSRMGEAEYKFAQERLSELAGHRR